MTKEELKKLSCEAIDNRQNDSKDITESIYNEPEHDYK